MLENFGLLETLNSKPLLGKSPKLRMVVVMKEI